ncbi:putative acyltransferase [Gordonia hirsuta DSM 44140 = NBRC 16056]|uniref:Putative acyltransferase n=1 Tax=Gordonia hirsuta DSM 44140 = NBRC 16056 TaxID=1121927 RepID=L7LA93_9ACTN|nr:acyltransferase [Gordonia hirsuta]GAC57676.1 putative acyltransferase [Gordonia hirsuta DSM 44140 = NBRC 16056]
MSAPVDTAADVRGARLPSLTGMRWWAALAVFVLHVVVFLPIYPFYGSDGYWDLAKAVPMQVGAAGVTFFFVLSGFVMWWTRRRNDTEVSFMWRRIKKIYPTHIVATVVLMLVIPIPIGRLDTWLPALALIQTWWPNWTSLGGLNVPAWSLASEMLFYLTFPFLAPLIARIPDRLVGRALGILFALIVAMHTALYLWAPGDKSTENLFGARVAWPVPATTQDWGYNASPEFFAREYVGYGDVAYWFSYYFPLVRLPEFFIGVLVCRLVLMGRFRNQRMLWPLLALAGTFAATWFVPINFKMSVLILLPTAAVIATAANRDVAGRRGLNSTRRMVWFGDISYAFYLIQYPVMVIVVRYLASGRAGGFWAWLGYAAVALILSTIAAALIYQYVDKPITGRKKTGRNKKVGRHANGGLTVVDIVQRDTRAIP